MRKMTLFRDMSVLYYEHFSFRSLLFTTTPQLHDFFQNTSVIVVDDFKVNPYGLPIITSLFSKAYQTIEAKYYGYLNSDILLQPTVFEVLHYCMNQTEQGVLAREHELAGRVYERDFKDIPTRFTSLNQLSEYFTNYSRPRQALRNRGSADYFIFSRPAMKNVMNVEQRTVIGRMQVDNYLMGCVWRNESFRTSELVDTTTVVLGIHEGKEGFYNRKVEMQSKENRNWNYGVMRNFSVHYGYLSERGNRVVHSNNGICCTLSEYTK
ncbi:hypothetical protein WA171_006379 [Blastocystis sp. BT1]